MNGHLILIILLFVAIFFSLYFAVKLAVFICTGILLLVLAHYIYKKYITKHENFTLFFEPKSRFGLTPDAFVSNDQGEKIKLYFINDAANVAAHPEIYCGTDAQLPDGYDAMGARNGCLKKGIGIGMGMSDGQIALALNRAANQPAPDPANRTYCGNANVLPAGYVAMATPNQCLRKGVGVGLRQPAARRQAFKNKPRMPLSKKELTDLTKRFGLNPDILTRQQARAQIANRL
jgi:hypothetical protein